jgi:restriction endonuclease S subunit
MMNIIEIPLPPLSKQQEIVSYLDQVFAQTKQIKAEYEAKLQQLKELKSSILQSAFEGKLI